MRLQDVLKEREQEIAQLEISLKEKETVVPTQPNLQEATVSHEIDNIDSPSVSMSPRKINQLDEIRTISHQGPGPDGADVMSNPETDESLDRLNELMRFVIAYSLFDNDSPSPQRNGSKGITAP